VASRPKLDIRRWLAAARASLAAIALALYFANFPHRGVVLYVLAVYCAYALVAAIAGNWRNGMLGLLALFADTVYFLVLAGKLTDSLPWLATVFLLFLLAEALMLHDAVEVAVVTATAALFCALVPKPEGLRDLERTVIVGGALACGMAIYRKRGLAEIEKVRDDLEVARTAADKATDLERQRIGSDFHDGPLQSFISLQMRLEILRKLLERDFEAGMRDLIDLQALAQSQVRDLRAFVHSMRPADVEGGNLVSTVRRIAEMFQKESGIPVAFSGSSKPVGLTPEVTQEVLAMVREALHNVQKHAAATRVAVSMEKADRALEISVDDNGHGFSFAGSYTLEELEMLRLGPASLKRRARALNAEMHLESRPGRGAGLKLRIPL